MAEEMVLDGGAELEIAPLEIEESGAELEGAEGAETALEGAEAEAGDETDQAASAVWKDVKERLKDVPTLHRQVKKALHTMEALEKRLPDGIEKTVQRIEAIQQLDDDPEDPDYMPGSRPFEDVISNTIAERTFWRDFDGAFQQGDHRVVNQMFEANPASFEKLVPAAMDKWSEVNPQDFSTYVCRSVEGYLSNAEIPLQLALLDRVLPQTSDDPGLQTVIQAVGAIKKVIGEIRSSAKRDFAPKAAAGAQNPTPTGQQPGNTEERELNVRHGEWMPEIRTRSNTLAANEAIKIAGKQKFSASELAGIRKAIAEEIGIRIKGDTAYQQKIKGFLKANNKAAFTSTVESKHKSIIPTAAKRAVQDALEKRTAGKASAKPVQQQQAAKPLQGQVQSNETFELIAGPPRTMGLKVDFSRTPHSMLAKDQAYIVGRNNPVKWRRK